MSLAEIILTLMQDFPYALYGSIIVGIVCAFLGVYIVTKRVVFLGAVLTQASVLGIAVTFLPMVAINHTLGSLIFAIVTVIIFSRILSGKKIPKDALLGVSFVTAIAARILIVQKTPKVEASEIENLLRGDILFVTPEMFLGLAVVAVAALAIHLLFFKEFQFVAFDRDTAQAHGMNVGLWEIIFYLSAGVVISVATHVVGDIFVFGFLVIPPTASLLLFRRTKSVFLFSALLGFLAPILGLILAFEFDVPASPAIVAVVSLVLATAWIVNLIRLR